MPHPGMVFYNGQWYSPEARARRRIADNRRSVERYARDPMRKNLMNLIAVNNREMVAIAARLEELDDHTTT